MVQHAERQRINDRDRAGLVRGEHADTHAADNDDRQQHGQDRRTDRIPLFMR